MEPSHFGTIVVCTKPSAHRAGYRSNQESGVLSRASRHDTTSHVERTQIGYPRDGQHKSSTHVEMNNLIDHCDSLLHSNFQPTSPQSKHSFLPCPCCDAFHASITLASLVVLPKCLLSSYTHSLTRTWHILRTFSRTRIHHLLNSPTLRSLSAGGSCPRAPCPCVSSIYPSRSYESWT